MQPIIPRFLEPDIRAHLSKKEITLLIGPRQAGKTTLLKRIANDLQANGETCLFFNLDIDRDAQFFGSQQQLIDRVEALTGGKKATIFIDEVQRITNAGLFLKGLFDRQLPYKWVATGSGSLELKEKIAESLAGRKRVFYLPPVSMAEFLCHKLGAPIEQISSLLATDSLSEDRFLMEYLQFGGYPNVVMASTNAEKNEVISEIFSSYIERDIQLLLRLEKSRSLVTLLQLIGHRIGRLVNYQDLANQTNLSVPTLKHYLWYCQKTFVVEEVLPFFTNKEKELVKSPQYYFTDCGMLNYLTGNRTVSQSSPEFGFLFQQLIFQLLKNRFASSIAAIRFWRTQNQAEVDFVVQDGSMLIPVEVKSNRLAKPQIERSLHSFIEIYRPAEAWVINRGLSETVMVNGTAVRFMAWHQLILPLSQ